MDNTLGSGISNPRKYAVVWYMDQSMWLCWIRWRNQRAKPTHRIQFQPETKRVPQPSQQSQHHENIDALRISTHATVTKHIRNSDQQASKHNPPLTRIPSTKEKEQHISSQQKQKHPNLYEEDQSGCCQNC